MNVKFLNILTALALIAILSAGCTPTEPETADQSAAPTPAETAPLVMPDAVTTDDVTVVTVNGIGCMLSDAQKIAGGLAARQGVPPQMIEQVVAQPGNRFQQQAIEQFVDTALAQDAATERGMSVSEEDVQKVVADIVENLPEGMTLEQVIATHGKTLEQLHSEITRNELMRKLYESETADIKTASDEEIAAFYNENPQYFEKEGEVQASHILIECKPEEDEAAHAKAEAEAEAIHKQLEDGADFAELAKEKSSCPSKDRGGDLGSFGRGRMVPQFEEAAFSQEIGVIGPVVKTPFGYHIIKVTSKSEAKKESMEEVKDKISEHLTMMAKQNEFGELLKELRTKAEISYAEGYAPAEENDADAE